MGRNSQRRRADKTRRARRLHTSGSTSSQPRVVSPDPTPGPGPLSEAAIEGMVVAAARTAHGPGENKVAFDRTVVALAAIEVDPSTPARPSAVIATMLHRSVTSLYGRGWQPADVAHAVKGRWTLRAHRLIIAIIANEARGTDAVHRAPQPWLTQLEELGVFEPTRGIIVGGYDNAIAGWARVERLDPDETITVGLQVLAQLLTLPPQAVLIDPPSAWGATNRGTVSKPSASRGDIDAKVLTRIRALLAKAEGTTFEAEAEAFTAKAQEMMTRYSIDAAVLASTATAAGADTGIESRRVHIDAPYADEKARFLAVIADVNAARSIWSPQVGFATVMGFPVDLHLTDLLFTSLLVQATKASAEATSADRRFRTPSFRRAFLIAFAHRIGERLEATKQHASADAAQQYGSALAPILVDREVAIEEAVSRAFPNATTMNRRRLNADGWYAGRAAADRAQIGASDAIARQ